MNVLCSILCVLTILFTGCGPSEMDLAEASRLDVAVSQLESLRLEFDKFSASESSAKSELEKDVAILKSELSEAKRDIEKLALESSESDKELLGKFVSLNEVLSGLKLELLAQRKSEESDKNQFKEGVERAVEQFLRLCGDMAAIEYSTPGYFSSGGSVLKRNGHDEALNAPVRAKAEYQSMILDLFPRELQSELRISLAVDITRLLKDWSDWKVEEIKHTAAKEMRHRDIYFKAHELFAMKNKSEKLRESFGSRAKQIIKTVEEAKDRIFDQS